MDDKNKKLFLLVFYFGLVSGILFMNYGFFHQSDFIQELMEKFNNLDKLQFVSKDEFFFYFTLQRFILQELLNATGRPVYTAGHPSLLSPLIS